MRKSVLFGILIGVFGCLMSICALGAFCFVILEAIMASDGSYMAYDYTTMSVIGLFLNLGLMIASIVLCVVFRKKENKARQRPKVQSGQAYYPEKFSPYPEQTEKMI